MTATSSPTLALSPSSLKQLATGRVVLASKSPRRKEILQKNIGLKEVSIFPSGFAEDLDKQRYAPFEYVMATASQKALDVYKAEIDSDHPPSIVIAADTVVLCNDRILEKPRGVDHHIEMLKSLRDSPIPHKAFTAVACVAPLEEPVSPGYAMESHIEVTSVHFKPTLTDEEITAYVQTGEGKDAAGGYKIQGEQGKDLVESIDGDYYNVVGLPIDATIRLIEKTIKIAQASASDDSSEEDVEVDAV